MFKNAIEKIKNFYDLDISKNTHADELFDILKEIIDFDSSAIFYLTPNKLTLEYGKNYEIFENIKIDENISQKLFDTNFEEISELTKMILKSKKEVLATRLIVKEAVLGIIFIERNQKFSSDEKIIFTTCASIISNLIKDLELSKVLKAQIHAMNDVLLETNQAYETIKKQNKKIKENEKLQNQFIANVSHDLRTPLNSIIGFSELLEQKLFGDLNEKQLEYISEIRISGLKLLAMINEILDISKLESNTMKLNITTININILINEVCNILKPLLDKKNLTIKKELPEELEITGDYMKLQQIFFNLIGNAIKFSNENSEIIVSATQNKKQTHISVKDFGIGIDKKYHKKIFNKFFQVQDTLSKSEASTGLGLTITKEFVKLHRGTIKIDSEINNGTTFYITIPQEIEK